MKEDFASRVLAAYHGEIYGEAFLDELANRVESPEHCYKLRVLARLEAETRRRLQPLVARIGGPLDDEAAEAAVRQRGRADASVLAELAWSRLLRTLHADFSPFVARYDELASLASEGDVEPLAYLAAHERALVAFLDGELSGAVDSSLEPVLALLG